MIRLAVSVEGETEEEFVTASLAPHLRCNGVYATPVLIGRARRPVSSGGNVSIDRLVQAMRHLSKSFEALIPRYRKTLHGPLLAREIWLGTMREECPRFDTWLEALEAKTAT